MIARCETPTKHQRPHYQDRGIAVCERWQRSFAAFHEDMGPCPAGKTLDRIDNYRGYEPGNVRWASWTAQALNKRVRCDSRSGVKGVIRSGSKWRAEIKANGITMRLGTFDSIDAAAAAQRAAQAQLVAELC